MPQNCKPVTTEVVARFFEEEIDGMGRRNGCPRNPGVSASIRQFRTWEFCELTEDEFRRLIIPDGTNTLIRDKDVATLGGSSKSTTERYLEILKSGENLSPLIARERLPNDSEHGSFYIEDGAHRALAYKIYFEGGNPYTPVKSYIGTRKV